MTLVLDQLPAIDCRSRPATETCHDLSIADLERCLSGIAYPTSKNGLIYQAKVNHAQKDVTTFFGLLPEGKYHQFNDIAFMAWSFFLI